MSKGDIYMRSTLEKTLSLLTWLVIWPKSGKAGNMALRYGSAPIEIQKGRTAVEVAKLEDLPGTIRFLMEVILKGELDDSVRFATTARGPKLKRKSRLTRHCRAFGRMRHREPAGLRCSPFLPPVCFMSVSTL